MCEVIFTVGFVEKVTNNPASGGGRAGGHALGDPRSWPLTFDPGAGAGSGAKVSGVLSLWSK